MKNFKRVLKLIMFVCLIVLASLGIGLAGPIPISPQKRKQGDADTNIEQVEGQEEETVPSNAREIRP